MILKLWVIQLFIFTCLCIQTLQHSTNVAQYKTHSNHYSLLPHNSHPSRPTNPSRTRRPVVFRHMSLSLRTTEHQVSN
jgi:hypothetical protein